MGEECPQIGQIGMWSFSLSFVSGKERDNKRKIVSRGVLTK